MTGEINDASGMKPRCPVKERTSFAIGSLRAVDACDEAQKDVARNDDERALLAAFRQVFDSEDRRYLIGVTRRCAEAQKPLRPVLQVVPADSAR